MAREYLPAPDGEVPYDITAFEPGIAWNEIREFSRPIAEGTRDRDCYDTDSCPDTWGCASKPPDCNITDSGCTERNCQTDPDMTCEDTNGCPDPDDRRE